MTDAKPERSSGELSTEDRQFFRYDFAAKGLDFKPVERLVDFRPRWWSWPAFFLIFLGLPLSFFAVVLWLVWR